jgi:hypothetical protein
MLRVIRNFFAKATQNAPSTEAADRDAFFRRLGESDIFIIAAMQTTTWPPCDGSGDR